MAALACALLAGLAFAPGAGAVPDTFQLVDTNDEAAFVQNDYVKELTVHDGQLFFSARSDEDPAIVYGLWATTTGLPSGTAQVDRMPCNNCQLENLTSVDGSDLFFSFKNTFTFRSELWKSDGTTISKVEDFDLGPGVNDNDRPSAISEIASYDGEAYFTAPIDATPTNSGRGREPWKSDGTAAGTELLKELRPGPGSSSPHGFVESNAKPPARPVLYFGADYEDTSGDKGIELIGSYGGESDTNLVADLNPGAANSSPQELTPTTDGDIVFRAVGVDADGDDVGAELFAASDKPSDPGDLSAGLVADILPGPDSSAPADFLWMPDLELTYFSATYPISGGDNRRGLFKTDPSGSTTRVSVFADPSELVAIDSDTIAMAADGPEGYGIYLYHADSGTRELVFGSFPGGLSDLTLIDRELWFAAGDDAWKTDLNGNQKQITFFGATSDFTPFAGNVYFRLFSDQVWVHGEIAPDTSIFDLSPEGKRFFGPGDGDATLRFEADEPVVEGFECRVFVHYEPPVFLNTPADVETEWADCPGTPDGAGAYTHAFSTDPADGELYEGLNIVHVRAIGVANGEPDPSPAIASRASSQGPGEQIYIDYTAPDTTITSGPGTTDDSTPTFDWSDGSTPRSFFGQSYECNVDATGWSPCPADRTLGPLPDGDHTLYVRGTDRAGNVEAVDAENTRQFTISGGGFDPNAGGGGDTGGGDSGGDSGGGGTTAPVTDGTGSVGDAIGDGTTDRLRPIFVRPGVNARQARRGRARRVVKVVVTGRLVKTQGRRCSGRVAVGLRLGGTKVRRTFQIQRSGKAPCTYRTVFRVKVRKLKRGVRSRRKRLLVRVNANYKGSRVLAQDKAPSVLKRAIR